MDWIGRKRKRGGTHGMFGEVGTGDLPAKRPGFFERMDMHRFAADWEARSRRERNRVTLWGGSREEQKARTSGGWWGKQNRENDKRQGRGWFS